MQHLASVRGKNAHETVRTAVSDVALVSRNIRGEYGIQILAYREDLFSFSDIPHGTEAEISTPTSADDEQFAGGTKVEAVRIAFREGDDAGDLEVVGII